MTIETFNNLYRKAVEPGRFINSFIPGHLVIEFLLKKLVQVHDPAMIARADNMTYAKLIELNYEIGTIDERQKKVLVSINQIRNKFAHQLTYEPSIDELKSLFNDAASAFSDMTDGISQGISELSSIETMQELADWVIMELFVQISYDLFYAYQSRGGDMKDF